MGARIILCDPHRVMVDGARRPCAEPWWKARTSAPGWPFSSPRWAPAAQSRIGNAGQIERGYERIDERLSSAWALPIERDRVGFPRRATLDCKALLPAILRGLGGAAPGGPYRKWGRWLAPAFFVPICPGEQHMAPWRDTKQDRLELQARVGGTAGRVLGYDLVQLEWAGSPQAPRIASSRRAFLAGPARLLGRLRPGEPNRLQSWLEARSPGCPDGYVLEVSSPGIEPTRSHPDPRLRPLPWTAGRGQGAREVLCGRARPPRGRTPGPRGSPSAKAGPLRSAFGWAERRRGGRSPIRRCEDARLGLRLGGADEQHRPDHRGVPGHRRDQEPGTGRGERAHSGGASTPVWRASTGPTSNTEIVIDERGRETSR